MNTKLIENITYKHASGSDIQLDLLVPDPLPATPTPLLVEIHGGGWIIGAKNGAGCRFLAEKGFITASIDYRLANVAPHPAQIDDCRDAIRWLRAHAADYAIDPARVGVWGASAGGHLVALLGASAAAKPDGDTWRVQAVVDFCGPTEIVDGDDIPYEGQNLYETLLGGPIAQHQDTALDAGPLHFVGPGMPPFLILHCADDDVVPVRHSVKLDAALKAAGADVTTVIWPTGGHGMEGHWGGEIEGMMGDFFRTHLA